VHFPSIWLLLLGIPLLQGSEGSGIKVTTQFEADGTSGQRTTYLQGDRERTEYRNSFGRKQANGSIQPTYGPRLARITRCDLGESYELNLDTFEYTSAPYPPKPLTEEEIKARGLETLKARFPESPTIRVEIKTTDTGERKEIFGHTARHVITTRTQTPLEGSHAEPQESVTDGWYIDFDQQLSCTPKRPEGRHGYTYGYLGVGNGKWPMEKPEFVTIGEPESGFALYSLVTSKSAYTLRDGTKKQSDLKNETRVTEFEEGPLDPALFEIPPGFKHVDRIERNSSASALASKP
jgi:hypothetical protein